MKRLPLADTALAVAIAVLAVGVAAVSDLFSNEDRHVDAFALALAAIAGLTLAVRRRYPLVTLAVVTAACTTYLLVGYPYGPILFAYFIAVYTVARYLPWSRSAPASAVALVVLLTHLLTNRAAFGGALGLLPGAAWAIVPFALGLIVRVQREAVARERAEEVRKHAYDERLRVAQEVHDVVGHGLAAIKMQAEIALHLLAEKPEQAETALTAISRTSTEALDEVRATLAVVRREDDARAPAPSFNRLEELRERMTESGMRIDLTTTGSPRELPVAADLAGYRVVQESLTNVLRHGAGNTATVRVSWEDDGVEIAVGNPSPEVPTSRDGLGIPGMRRRITSLGGTFSAGPTGDGRFEVRARIPLEARS
ncbi:sensor histidine kinase [Amycolatopsis alkalitolerans]|uniref:histidine kinase n=1 Tax=Amycolatopsis alkalitolerans TaxID=2547244 RepID=A0A5C4LQ94_9PSEU|nr:histidine kinase [Amycolatopsis alkalitolerans]TNC20054.1 sensor histidine kinase [Amycolatopsis alkalitolerans]